MRCSRASCLIASTTHRESALAHAEQSNVRTQDRVCCIVPGELRCRYYCNGGSLDSYTLPSAPAALPAYLSLTLVSASTIAAHVHCGFSARGDTSPHERITGEPRSLA